MKPLIIVVLFLCMACVSLLAQAQEIPLDNPALEERAVHLFQSIRCQVCQGESLDGSHASLAKDMRVLIRHKIAAGETDSDIRAFLVARYGEPILMETPFSSKTFLLWALPLLALILGFVCILRRGGRTQER